MCPRCCRRMRVVSNHICSEIIVSVNRCYKCDVSEPTMWTKNISCGHLGKYCAFSKDERQLCKHSKMTHTTGRVTLSLRSTTFPPWEVELSVDSHSYFPLRSSFFHSAAFPSLQITHVLTLSCRAFSRFLDRLPVITSSTASHLSTRSRKQTGWLLGNIKKTAMYFCNTLKSKTFIFICG